ncbi:hemolysin-III protein [Lophiostoma macrostomum CBS 122681]|uniref:Hemolysin-III protein n=1 Tax=Lophiostoma macrostomum CBS 122681 TaxID=1314788 RepID=A0A6A6T3W2_9PLEO|nr:hemolysin-III protein [Lophiostoma macrostomum CBS 122681]
MSGSGVKKRHVQVDDFKTMPAAASATGTRAEARTITFQEIPEWQRDNKHILRGYRRSSADYLEVIASLTFLHNETCNVYTHLVGALLLPLVAAISMRALSQFLNVLAADYIMFAFFFFCAECCLVLSTLYHLLGSHSYEEEQFWLQMDLLGIIIVTLGTFIPGIYYLFTCEPVLQKVHWAIITTSASATAILVCVPRFRRWRTLRTVAYVALGASSFIPLIHGVQRYGFEYMMQYSSMKWYLIELSLYGSGVGLYAFRIPERFAPGTFDILGASHQIFHAAILCAMYIHVVALTHAFKACHTLDLCKVKAARGVHL